MRHRMVAAALALAGLLLSLYLLLYHYGVVGSLQCGVDGGCERVQASRYAMFLGLPVAAYGVGGYATLFAIAFAGVQPRWAASRAPTLLLVAFAALGVAFTIYLKYLEFFVIGAVCRWCVGSAVLILAVLVAGVSGLTRDKGTKGT